MPHISIIIIVIIMFVILSSFIILALCNKYLPKWFCIHMGWHLAPIAQSFDGCSYFGVCPRCKKHVLQDSQGNWF